MAASAPAKDKKKNGPAPLVPPDEQFWKRYSPHHEASLSIAGSIALHALAVGTMILFAVYLAALFLRPNRSLPIEPVRLAISGGGGQKSGVDGGKGVGGVAEDIGVTDKNPQPGEDDAAPRPSLTPAEIKKAETAFDPDSFRRINKSDTGKTLARLEDSVREKLRSSLNAGAKGEGGTGSGGGKGTGSGKGVGPGTGAGTSALSQREKRMLRWHMKFTANTGPDYLAQLRGLGAVLAFPISETQYKLVRDLNPGGPLLDEDISSLNRIYWFDENPQSVRDILSTLGAKISPAPARFVAFMPKSLEDQLHEMEKSYVKKVLRKPLVEDRIEETLFRVVRDGKGGYKPELISVTMR